MKKLIAVLSVLISVSVSQGQGIFNYTLRFDGGMTMPINGFTSSDDSGFSYSFWYDPVSYSFLGTKYDSLGFPTLGYQPESGNPVPNDSLTGPNVTFSTTAPLIGFEYYSDPFASDYFPSLPSGDYVLSNPSPGAFSLMPYEVVPTPEPSTNVFFCMGAGLLWIIQVRSRSSSSKKLPLTTGQPSAPDSNSVCPSLVSAGF